MVIRCRHREADGGVDGKVFLNGKVHRNGGSGFLRDLPYQHWEETDNPAYRLFLGELRQPLPAMAALVGP